MELFLNYRQDIGCVIENKHLIGIVTKYSLYRLLLRNHATNATIEPAIKTDVVTLQEHESAYRAKDILIEKDVGHAVILNGDRQVVGVMTKPDLIRGLITEGHHLAGELEMSKRIEKILDSALEATYDGIIITDNDGNITKANHGVLELYDMTSFEQIINRPIRKVAPEIEEQVSEGNEANLVQIKQKKAIVSKTPIIQDQQKIGAIYKIIYEQLSIWKDLFRHVEKLEDEITYYRGELSTTTRDPFAPMISRNARVEKLKEDALIAAQSTANLLITGESGTGKELIANGVHLASERSGAFIKINCAAIPESLLESEFFGYVDGAFTGARKGGKPGKFQLAHHGTLFLDEIGDMPFSLQAKLLRVIQEGEYERIGDTQTHKVDVRMIAATNKDLLQLVREGQFREDLYYRMNVIQLTIPPLRERRDDIPELAAHFLKKLRTKQDKDIVGITPTAMEKLQNYHWPGNVRQLENALERAFLYSKTGWIEGDHILLDVQTPISPTSSSGTSDAGNMTPPSADRQSRIEEVDKKMIIDALQQADGNRTKAAKTLGISRSTLYQKLKKYDIKETTTFSL